MISNTVGTILKKNTKTKSWWIKLGIALILSNIFFYVLFSGESKAVSEVNQIPQGWVEVQLQAELLTPFQSGKKVLLVQRKAGRQVMAVLNNSVELDGKITVLVKEDEAHELFRFDSWEILPFLKNLKLGSSSQRESHEIRY